MAEFHLFFDWSDILLYTYMCVCECSVVSSSLYIYIYIFFIHSSVDGHLGCFHIRASVNNVAMNIGVHVSFQIMVFSGYLPRSGIAGSYDSSIFSFLRDLHTVLHSGASIYIITNCVRGFPFLHTLSRIYCCRFFLMIAILTGVR